MVAFSNVKMIPPPPADASKKAVRQHIVDHIYAMPEFMRCATHIGLHAQGGPPAAGQLDKARVEARAIVARLPPIERFNVQWVLRLANATAAKAWEVLSVKGPRKRMVPIPAPAPARSVSDAHKPRARQPLASRPYDRTKRPARRAAPAPAPNNSDEAALAAMLARASLDDVPAPQPAERVLADAVEELCSTFGKTHIAPPVPTAPVPATPALFAVPVFAAPVPAAAPTPAAPRRATVDLPEVDTAPVYCAPAADPEPLIYIPCVRKTRARAPTRAPYSKAARKPVKLAPPPVLECDAEVPYIEAVTETFSGEHLFTEVHILDARPLRDGRLARRESRGWRRIAVA